MRMVKRYISGFVEKRKLPWQESLLWSFESIIYILGAFYAGFRLRETNNLIFLVMLAIILTIRFSWYKIEQTTKKVKLI